MNDCIDSSQIRPAEMAAVRAWSGLFTGAKAPPVGAPAQVEAERHSTNVPFSFTCGARSSRDWLKLENASRDSGEWQDGQRLHLLRWRDPETSLSCTYGINGI